MKSALRSLLPLALCAGVALAACSQPSGAPAPTAAQQQAQADAATAARNLATYRQLVRIGDDEMVVAMGKDILSRFPGSDAAKEVQQTLPAIEQRYAAKREKNRLAGLWVYQVAPMAGGTQSTAAIYNSEPVTGDKVQLVLRRHTSWGQSVFLYGSKPGFVCRGNCTILGHADGKTVRIKAFAPSTGEPALMIINDKAFLALLKKTRKLSLEVTFADGDKKQTLVYELAGFDPARWQPLPGGGKKR
ncbi:MAG: hypothetical protein KGH90_06985 [Xanthomonadaceae bacterium]|nr:hypothetical protein [Xanthomonadaceae bacterium]